MQRTVEWIESLGVMLIGILLLLVIEPVTPLQLLFAGILAGLVIVIALINLWGLRHSRRQIEQR